MVYVKIPCAVAIIVYKKNVFLTKYSLLMPNTAPPHVFGESLWPETRLQLGLTLQLEMAKISRYIQKGLHHEQPNNQYIDSNIHRSKFLILVCTWYKDPLNGGWGCNEDKFFPFKPLFNTTFKKLPHNGPNKFMAGRSQSTGSKVNVCLQIWYTKRTYQTFKHSLQLYWGPKEIAPDLLVYSNSNMPTSPRFIVMYWEIW